MGEGLEGRGGEEREREEGRKWWWSKGRMGWGGGGGSLQVEELERAEGAQAAHQALHLAVVQLVVAAARGAARGTQRPSAVGGGSPSSSNLRGLSSLRVLVELLTLRRWRVVAAAGAAAAALGPCRGFYGPRPRHGLPVNRRQRAKGPAAPCVLPSRAGLRGRIDAARVPFGSLARHPSCGATRHRRRMSDTVKARRSRAVKTQHSRAVKTQHSCGQESLWSLDPFWQRPRNRSPQSAPIAQPAADDHKSAGRGAAGTRTSVRRGLGTSNQRRRLRRLRLQRRRRRGLCVPEVQVLQGAEHPQPREDERRAGGVARLLRAPDFPAGQRRAKLAGDYEELRESKEKSDPLPIFLRILGITGALVGSKETKGAAPI